MGKFDALFSDVELQIMKTMDNVLADAVTASKKQLESDFKINVVDMAVNQYYEEYTPTRYKRSYSLYNAFKVKVSTHGSKFNINLNGDDARLQQHVSNSAYHKTGGNWISRYSDEFSWDEDNGIPKNEWILENFYEGLHPITEYDKDTGTYIWEPIQTSSFTENINEYARKYYSRMLAILFSNVKKQCKKYFK